MNEKRLGQNFLINKSKLKKIASALELKENDRIIEIGTGHGELTNEIIKEFKNRGIEDFKLISIEKDPELQPEINENKEKVRLTKGDALKILPELAKEFQDYKFIGNIPYYITGHLLRIISELENKPEISVLTLQKEVAERICNQPPKMNLLAAITQSWAKPEIITFISKKDFRPIPKVDSAVIKLMSAKGIIPPAYFKFVKLLFKQPRKTILNNLSEGLQMPKERIRKMLKKLNISENERPQNLSLKNIKTIFKDFVSKQE